MHRQVLTNHLTNRTSCDALFFNPQFLPPASAFYGAVCPSGFKVSKMFDFDGKPWQLRTILFRDKHYIAPFVINSGGVASTAPILGTPLLKKIGAIVDDNSITGRASWSNEGGLVKVPSPLGELSTVSDWDEGEAKISNIDERYNLIGLGWAAFQVSVEAAARRAKKGTGSPVETEIQELIEFCPDDIAPYIRHPENKIRVERELRAMIDAVKDERSIDKLAEAWATSN